VHIFTVSILLQEEEKQQNAKRGLLGPVTAPMRRRTVENAAEGGWACDVCGLVFSTGQALGGHKGSHKSTDYYTVSGFSLDCFQTQKDRGSEGSRAEVIGGVTRQVDPSTHNAAQVSQVD
jgi:hypothetical protein